VKAIRLAQTCAASLALGSLIASSLPPQSYVKDLQVEYLTARALRDGVDVFTPVSELSARYFPVHTENFPHPNPHPPVLTLISVPFTLLPFPVVALLWLFLNFALLLIIGRWLKLSIYASLELAAWPPIWWLLFIGQWELLILVLVMQGWRAAAVGKDSSAGLWLGAAAALKFYPALLLLPFVVRRRVRVLVSAGTVFVLSQLAGLIAVGWTQFLRYYTVILPAVSARYVHMGLNSSPYGALLRLFGGSSDVLPLINAPGIVLPTTIAISVLALVVLGKVEPEGALLPLLVALPASWYYYTVLALPQIVTLWRSANSKRATLAAAAAASVVLPLINLVLVPALRWMQWSGDKAPPVAGVLAAIQPAGLVALLLLSVAQMRRRASAHLRSFPDP